MAEFLEAAHDLGDDLGSTLLDDRRDDVVDDHAPVVLVDVAVLVEIRRVAAPGERGLQHLRLLTRDIDQRRLGEIERAEVAEE